MFEGPQFAVSCSTEGAWERAGNGAGVLRSNGRADFGSDPKLEGSLFLGFESFYSVPGRKELESYGTGLVPRLDFLRARMRANVLFIFICESIIQGLFRFRLEFKHAAMMTPEEIRRFCSKANVFMATEKSLCGLEPKWSRGSRRNQMVGIWPVKEEGRDEIRGYHVFSLFSTSLDQPSVSLIFCGREVCRLDVKPSDELDENPDYALRLGLPKMVSGTHIHPWEHNRDYKLTELAPARWNIPVKTPISQSTRGLRQMLPCICNHCAIYLLTEQRIIHAPKRREFPGGKP